MKQITALMLLLTLFLWGCTGSERPEDTPPTDTCASVSTEAPIHALPAKPIVPLPLEPVREFSDEEKQMLLKIGMAELGRSGCQECVALVMCTILKRVESGRFGSSIRAVLFAPEQFTPVMDGSYAQARPNELCFDAYEMVVHGWDESQGALYYEFCEGESWHSQNLQLLFQHCNTRFYQ